MNRFERIILSLMLALLLGGATLIIAEAAQAAQPQNAAASTGTAVMTNENCAACHHDVADHWMQGLHAQSFSDQVFADAWAAQGQPGACLVCHTTGYDPATGTSVSQSVSCQSCHSPIPANHPTDKMPVDKSPELCGKCHSDPRFATENWQLSAHYQRDMTCAVCHDPHTAGMKTITGDAAAASLTDASDLCANCHKDAMKNFPTSKHAEAGVTCVNCHLDYKIGDQSMASFSELHKAPDHTFMPTLVTCNKCHSNQMHAPGEAIAAAAMKAERIGGTETPEPANPVTAIPEQTSEPLPVSPIGFAAMAGLLGLAGGMVLAPWLERAYRHWNKRGE